VVSDAPDFRKRETVDPEFLHGLSNVLELEGLHEGNDEFHGVFSSVCRAQNVETWAAGVANIMPAELNFVRVVRLSWPLYRPIGHAPPAPRRRHWTRAPRLREVHHDLLVHVHLRRHIGRDKIEWPFRAGARHARSRFRANLACHESRTETAAMTRDTTARTASCGCGGLTATVSGEPSDVYACSCLDCQRESGSVFTYVALFPADAVTPAGEHRTWRRSSDSGRWIETTFCPTCAGAVLSRMEALPDSVGVAVGCFADPDFKRPDIVFWASRRHHWLDMPEAVELMETQPG
jgi:hypothetical protein